MSSWLNLFDLKIYFSFSQLSNQIHLVFWFNYYFHNELGFPFTKTNVCVLFQLARRDLKSRAAVFSSVELTKTRPELPSHQEMIFRGRRKDVCGFGGGQWIINKRILCVEILLSGTVPQSAILTPIAWVPIFIPVTAWTCQNRSSPSDLFSGKKNAQSRATNNLVQ